MLASSSNTVRGPTATTDGAGGRRSGRPASTPRSSRVTMGLGPVGASPRRCQKIPPRAGAKIGSTPAGPWAARAAIARSSSKTTGTGTRARRAASPSRASSTPPPGRTTTSSSGTASTTRRHRAWAVARIRTRPGPSVGAGAGRCMHWSSRARTSIRPPITTAACTAEPPRWRARTVGMGGVGRVVRSGACVADDPTASNPRPGATSPVDPHP